MISPAINNEKGVQMSTHSVSWCKDNYKNHLLCIFYVPGTMVSILYTFHGFFCLFVFCSLKPRSKIFVTLFPVAKVLPVFIYKIVLKIVECIISEFYVKPEGPLSLSVFYN